MPTLTRGATVITPTLVLGYETSREVPTVTHVLLNGATRHTLRPGRPRTGTLTLFFATYTAAWAAFSAFAAVGSWVYVESDVPAAGMTFLVSGSVTIALDPVTAIRWTVAVPYVEVL